MSQTTLATVPKLLAQVLRVYDIDPQPIFLSVDIPYDSNDPGNARVSMQKMANLWQCCAIETANPQLGLIAASMFQPAYLKGIGLAWMASATLEQGLYRFLEQGKMINTAMQLTLTEQDEDLLIQYRAAEHVDTPAKAHPCSIQLGLGFFLKIFRLAAGKNIPATAVYFSFPIEQELAVYTEYFQCPVYPDSQFNGIAFSKSLLRETLPAQDAELVALNEEAVQRYIGKMGGGVFCGKVLSLLSELLPSGCPSEEMIAFKLHMSKRTLQRKLKEEGSAYLQLLNHVRITLAKECLCHSEMSMTEISYHLGYSSPSTFARAFKQLTTSSPLKYREQFKA